MFRTGCIVLALMISTLAQAQNQPVTLTGKVISRADGTALPGVHVVLISSDRTQNDLGVTTDDTGTFSLRAPAPGDYRLHFSFVGFETLELPVVLAAADRSFGTVRLRVQEINLDELTVEAVQERVVLKGDTTEYNADAFKVNPDATAEDLAMKMPGISVEEGSVEAHGENVRQVLVDGREFFGNDPVAALRILPAEIIDRIQVFDRASDQAQFTGFDDGETEKTINIITRSDRSNGQFGKIYAGYGADQRYNSGGNVNVFDGDRRISVIGLSNNINMQNFATEDLLGVLSGGSSRGGGGMRMAGRPGGGGGMSGGGMGGRAGGGMGAGMRGGGGAGMMGLRTNPSSFMVDAQGGINQTSAIGLNYSDQWGTKIQVTGSYFFNTSDNQSESELDRELFLSETESQLYNETNASENTNYNHRINFRMRARLDDRNEIIFSPRISLQSNDAINSVFGINTLTDMMPLSSTTDDYVSSNSGFTSNSSLLFRHQFEKQGRTASANFSVGWNDRSGDSELHASNVSFSAADSSLYIDQQTENEQGGLTLSTRLSYTEPVGPGMVELSYNPSITRSDSDRLTNQYDDESETYNILDPATSSSFDSKVLRQQGGIAFRMRQGVGMLSAGLNVQGVNLTGEQTFPSSFAIDRSFVDLLPQAMAMFRFSPSANLRLNYRTSTDVPSVSQLQEVIDNTNPLQLSGGNPDLDQSYSHTMFARYNKTDALNGRVFIGFLSVSAVNRYIGNETLVALADTVLVPGVTLAQGSQYTTPVNLNGYWNARSLFTYGFPSRLLGSNVNLTAGYTFSRAPGIINSERNTATTHGVSGGLVIGSNISEAIDFTISYTASANLVQNSLYADLDANYVFHRTSAKFNWMPSPSWVIQSDFRGTYTQGLADAYSQSNLLWNASIAYKFLSDKRGEARLIVADILNRNNAISRTVNEFYVEDSRTNVLGRVVLLTLSYKLRHFRV